MLKEKLETIKKELKYEFKKTAYKSEDIRVSDNSTLIKKLEKNRQTIADSFMNDTSVYKK